MWNNKHLIVLFFSKRVICFFFAWAHIKLRTFLPLLKSKVCVFFPVILFWHKNMFTCIFKGSSKNFYLQNAQNVSFSQCSNTDQMKASNKLATSQICRATSISSTYIPIYRYNKRLSAMNKKALQLRCIIK